VTEIAPAFRALSSLAKAEAVLALSGFAAVVAYLCLTGRIAFGGLLSNKTTGHLDPGRVQLLLSTLLLSGTLLGGLGHRGPHPVLTVPSDWLVFLYGSSQGVYLVRKVLQVQALLKGA